MKPSFLFVLHTRSRGHTRTDTQKFVYVCAFVWSRVYTTDDFWYLSQVLQFCKLSKPKATNQIEMDITCIVFSHLVVYNKDLKFISNSDLSFAFIYIFWLYMSALQWSGHNCVCVWVWVYVDLYRGIAATYVRFVT